MSTRASPSLHLPVTYAMQEHAESASSLLKAMANPHRLLILCLLAEGELSVGTLNERIPLSQSALSQHLAVLRADGLVATRREAQTIYYSVQPGPALDVIRSLHAHYCGVKPHTAGRKPGKRPRGETS
jgi:DNA-binding transcriptional ArsR family regulator